jgi:type IV secretion system protein VirB10
VIRIPWRRVFQPEMANPRPPADSQSTRPREASSTEPAAPWTGTIRGERAAFIVSGARSLQSRMPSLLAAGLMISVGAGMLAWYYTEALSRPSKTRASVHAPIPDAAGEGISLPPFDRIASPPGPLPTAIKPSAPLVPAAGAPPSSTAGRIAPAAPVPLYPRLVLPLNPAPVGLPPGYGALPRQSPRQRALQRRLSGEVFAQRGSSLPSHAAALPLGTRQEQMPASGPSGSALETLLRPGIQSATRAQLLPTQRLLLPKGTFIDCTLETAIDSTLPGMTTCVTATDTFGADGTVVLLERGTKLIGETRGEMRQGDARVFVVWTEARTPSGVVVQLDSPGTDALGRSGLEGRVNRHFWQRFGAAALVSTIDGAVQSEVQSSSRSGTVVLDPTASEDVLSEILRSTVNIPPTIRVPNGARIQILVARDVDFRPVYELEPR